MQLIHFSEDGNSRIGVKTEHGFLNLAKAAAALSLPFPAYIDDAGEGRRKAAQLVPFLAQADELTDASLYVSPEDGHFPARPVPSRQNYLYRQEL